ncbi:FliH/SctL family protein [Novosphingobium sp. 11B]|uniref:FliH/SctL family protein n=1 Tax=Sphingomonas sp. LH128 TaxID=473781 RepID=UPI00027CA469|nr:FliH/SctL family protein [Sphingomonas sp. LH128]EJU09737.1 FlbE protein [Sphingomonas sp. LH128]
MATNPKAPADGAGTIQPFGFDRVFFHPVDTPLVPVPGEPEPASAAETLPESLRDRIEDLESRIERMQAEHRAELARARADGFEAGAAQARSERGEALLAATDALHAALDGIEGQVEAVARRMIGEAGAVALHAAEMLAGHAIETSPARAVDEALARALEQVAQGTALVVRVNPEMRDEVDVLVEAREAKCGRPLAITVIDDEAVPQGDARIEWTSGGLNVDAEARRAAVMAELAGVLL